MQKIVGDQRHKPKPGDREEPTADPSKASVGELAETGEKITKEGQKLPHDQVDPGDDPEGTTEVYTGSTSEGVPAETVRPEIVIEHKLKVDVVTDEHDLSSKDIPCFTRTGPHGDSSDWPTPPKCQLGAITAKRR